MKNIVYKNDTEHDGVCALKAKGIVREFPLGNGETFCALKGVDITVPKGKLTILKGRSGSGKTTLLNIISALDEATGGQVFYGEREISAMKF